MNDMEKKERIIDILEGLPDSYQVSIHNEYCDLELLDSNKIISMDEFNETFEDRWPFEIAEIVTNGDFHTGDDWFSYDGYENIVSTNTPYELMDFDAIADYIISHRKDFGISDIRDVIDDRRQRKLEVAAKVDNFDDFCDIWDSCNDCPVCRLLSSDMACKEAWEKRWKEELNK